MIKRIVEQAGYFALRSGFRLPRTNALVRYSEQSYLIDLIKRLGANVFVDVGASFGNFAKHVRMAGFNGPILSFEPSAADFQKLQATALGDRLWQVFNLALGTEDTTRSFNVIGEGENVWSSFLPPASGSKLAVARTETVQLKRGDSVIAEAIRHVAEPRIFMKIDTQGYDLEVIEGCSKIMPKVVGFQSEVSIVPLYDKMPHYTKALEHYETLGFSLMNLVPVSWTECGGILEYDCLMAREKSLMDIRQGSR